VAVSLPSSGIYRLLRNNGAGGFSLTIDVHSAVSHEQLEILSRIVRLALYNTCIARSADTPVLDINPPCTTSPPPSSSEMSFISLPISDRPPSTP
jgi:hypothetical protein